MALIRESSSGFTPRESGHICLTETSHICLAVPKDGDRLYPRMAFSCTQGWEPLKDKRINNLRENRISRFAKLLIAFTGFKSAVTGKKMNAERDRLRAIKAFNDLDFISNDILAHRSMKFKGIDYGLEKELRALATTIARKLRPLVNRKP